MKNEYGEVAQSVSKAFREELFKHEGEAREAAIRIARIYGMDDEMANAMVEQVEKFYTDRLHDQANGWNS